MVAEAAARGRSRVARRCHVGGRSVGGARCLRGGARLEAHGGALGRGERDVGDVVGVVAADEGHEGVDHVEDKEQTYGQNAPLAVGDVVDEGVDESSVSR